MNVKKSDSGDKASGQIMSNAAFSDTPEAQARSGACSQAGNKIQTSDGKYVSCFEIFAFRSILEKLACVDQEGYTWTWDHETDTFLIQAGNNVIQQYVNILTGELGEALCLHLKKVSIIVDLRPWKIDTNKTSLRIGFEGSHVPAELCGHTGLEDIVNLHFTPLPDDAPDIKKALKDFKLTCCRIDNILERKCEWMWERHWRPDGLAFAVVRAYSWMNRYMLVEKEIELFNDSPANKDTGLRIELSTYNRGTSFNVRITLDGLGGNLRTGTPILDVFDHHFSGSISRN